MFIKKTWMKMRNWVDKGKFEFEDDSNGWYGKCLYILLSTWLKLVVFMPWCYFLYNVQNWQLAHFTAFMDDYA